MRTLLFSAILALAISEPALAYRNHQSQAWLSRDRALRASTQTSNAFTKHSGFNPKRVVGHFSNEYIND
jgi:hypothetical protein